MSLVQTIYYVIVTAFTLGDNNTTSVLLEGGQLSKLLSILFIPIVIPLLLRSLVKISDWVVAVNQSSQSSMHTASSPQQTTMRTTDVSLTPSDLRDLLTAAQMEDGLLTRAEFLELILLAMKKVDPELIVALREGFDQVTQSGAIDLTRQEWLDAAAKPATGEFV
jgi:hypothetical protein